MSNKINKTIIGIIVVIVLLAGGYFLFRGADQETPQVPQQSNETSKETTMPTSTPPLNQVPTTVEKVVIYTDKGFSPPILTIKKGETVTFKNQSSNSMWPASAMHPTHRAYSKTSLSEHCPDTAGNAFDACKGFLPGETWSFNFHKTGSWNYHNHLNPRNTGVILVE